MAHDKEETPKDPALAGFTGQAKKEETKKPDGFGRFNWKEIVFFFITGALLVFDGYAWKQLLIDGGAQGPVSYVLPLALMVAFAVFFSLSAMLVTQKWIAWLLFLGASFGAIGFIPLWTASFVAMALVFCALLYAFHSMQGAYRTSTTFHAGSVLQGGLSSVFTALVVMISFYYLQSKILHPPDIIPTGLIESITSLTGGIVERQLGGLIDKVGRDAGEQVEGQIQKLRGEALTQVTGGQGISLEGLPSELLRLIPQDLLKFLSLRGTGGGVAPGSEASQLKIPTQNIAQEITKRVDPSNIVEGIGRTVEARINKIIEPYKPFIPYVFTVLFFLTAKGLTFFLKWITLPVVSLILKFLITIGFVRKEKVMIEVERIFF